RPGVYDQLAELYRRRGREEKAIDVAIAKQRRRRSKLSRPSRLWSWILDISVGYGYKSHRALGGLLALVIVGCTFFSFAYPADFRNLEPRRGHSDFSALFFSIDAVLPIVNLGQEKYWSPTGFAATVYRVLVLGGWLLTTILVAALTGLLKRSPS
ncbi:MAG TPA: hypothetical protein VN179_04340, partial [Solirubrobacterales bacterium]|nr:hypothetical protein [Solirubrobacterales bacterium]